MATALWAALLATRALAAPPPPAIGQPAALLQARSFNGAPIDLQEQLGHVVVLNFWASWCSPCRAEMPQLDALYQEYRGRGLVVIGLSADDPHDRKDAERAARPFSYATGMLAGAAANGFGSPRALPVTYVIAADGIIAAILTANQGAFSAAQLREAVARLLPPAPSPGS